jgi:Sel1 repeat
MKAGRLALMFATILSLASIAQAISVVLVTDDAGMHALADSDKRGLIRGTVSSVESKQDGGGPPDAILHFAGVKNDQVFAAITDTTPWQDLYGRDLSGLVGKTVEIMSKAAEKDSGQIYFGTSYYPDFRVVESGSVSTETASIPAAPSGSASVANSATSKVPSIDAGTIAKLEKLGNDGDMQAQEELGSIYFAGHGTIPKDYKKAVFWFQKAVDQNKSLKANLFLARMYENGWGVDQDSDLAYDYYESVERSPGNQALKQAIAPEWTKVQKEKQASIEASNHVDYVDAEGKLHPAGASYRHSTFSPGFHPAAASPRVAPKGLVRKSERYWDAYRTDIIRKVFDGDFGSDMVPLWNSKCSSLPMSSHSRRTVLAICLRTTKP